MKIISKYHDYYDAIMRSGYDENIVFVRKGWDDDPIYVDLRNNTSWHSVNVNKTKCASAIVNHINSRLIKGIWVLKEKRPTVWGTVLKIEKWFNNSKKYRRCRMQFVNPYIVGFCGKFYVIYEVTYYDSDDLYKKFFITKDNHAAFRQTPKPRAIVGEENGIFKGDINQMFLDLDCPIFWLDMQVMPYKNAILVRNPILKDIQFQKLVDPYTAYQELSMFFGSVFANDEDNMVSISDRDKAVSKGFDKWSFKKPPTKKRNNA